MTLPNDREILVINGPTAIGKTDVSITAAKNAGAEIISCDARQFYKHMAIGTAKPTPEQLAAVPHHFVDFLDPAEYYSAGVFSHEARAIIDQLIAAGKRVIIVGGSGFYLKALLEGLFEEPAKDEAVKTALQKRINREGTENLFRELRQKDPESADKIMQNDAQRIIRALEVLEVTGKPLSYYHTKTTEPIGYPVLKITLHRPRAFLYERINKRVDIMLKNGLLDEVRSLLEIGYTEDMNALKTVGYAEVFEYLKNEITYDEMTELIKQHTRNYAKRQVTWFKKDKESLWYTIGKNEEPQLTSERITRFWLTQTYRQSGQEFFSDCYP